jgi:hypothetical protein
MNGERETAQFTAQFTVLAQQVDADVALTSQLTVSASVCLGVEPLLGLIKRIQVESLSVTV